ncbi:MAG: DUF192 domain-containing protein, partial [Patescibacteria group bacterium]|nr:DUF192 domain-containing protein [Patescibacteria group bacterium]
EAKGLIGAEKAEPMLFKTRWGIHTFGVRFPIDVVIFGKNGLVVKIKAGLKPGKLFFWNPKFCDVLELPEGAIKKSGLKIGDVLKIEQKQTDDS